MSPLMLTAVEPEVLRTVLGTVVTFHRTGRHPFVVGQGRLSRAVTGS
jgi:hypothetical protein